MDIGNNIFTNLIAFSSLILSAITLRYYLNDRNKIKYAITNEYVKQLLEWHGETVEVLINLRSCSEMNKNNLLDKLSTQIEKGRFYFPNIDKGDSFGREKPAAYQGYRNLTLDFLVYSHNLFKEKDCQEFYDHAIILQREFTSNVFQIIRPKEILNEIKILTDKFFTSEEIFEDFFNKEASSNIFIHHNF